MAIPTDRATSGWSPVAITTFSTPRRRSARIVYAASARTWSSKTRAPAIAPSIEMYTTVGETLLTRLRNAVIAAGSGDPSSIQASFPTATSRPPSLAETPAPCCSLASLGHGELETALASGFDDGPRQDV
jgi:hypothetical protein